MRQPHETNLACSAGVAVNDMEFFTVLDQQGVATRQQPSTIA